ncbi:MAG: small multi-drug export protein [Deltaproteobacteria bacterium]|nr:small multi-drug export protein [Deltaproteobacteria bacterium]
MNLTALLWVIALTLTPTLELRASIPYAILGAGLSPWAAGALGVAANTALAPLVWIFLDKALHLFLRIGWFSRLWERYAERKRASLQRLVDRYGVLGLALFIGVPLPGTGVYSGAVAAYLLGYRFRDYMLASFLGCLLAGAAVTAVVASGSEVFAFVYKH